MNPRTLAVVFTTLLMASTLPAAEATHLTPVQHPIDEIRLPHARPTQDCSPLSVQPQILARINMLLADDPAFYETEFGVPAVCTNGGPNPQVQALVAQLDDELDRLRILARQVQDQVNIRLEDTLPEGLRACQFGNDVVPRADAPAACGLVEPRVVLLNDSFDGRRTTGFGDWTVVTERGEDALWTIETRQTINGTRASYRFGDSESYAHGAHQWLVSPEIDLTALRANKTAVQDLTVARDLAASRARAMCNSFTIQGQGPGILRPTCGDGSVIRPGVPSLDVITRAYEEAFDATIYELPVMQHGAYLDLTYRMNFAPDEDGVRVWIYSGERAPDRSILFGTDIKRPDQLACTGSEARPFLPAAAQQATDGTVRGNPTARGAVCTTPLEGGQVLRGLNGTRASIRTFADPRAPDHFNNTGLSGYLADFATSRVNLTPYMDERVWILFEAKTERNDRGQDKFNDTGRFTLFERFGFELARVFVEGDGYHRNVRLKDVGATFPQSSRANPFGDSPNTTRTTIPPGNESIVAYVHNAGTYAENVTFVLNVASAPKAATPNFGAPSRYNVTVRDLAPSEVREVVVRWSDVLPNNGTLRENHLYRLDASIGVPTPTVRAADATEGPPDRLPQTVDPNATRARPANAAGTVPGAGALNLTQLVRAATLRNLTPVRADGQFGTPIEFCGGVDGTRCEPPSYAARKGEARTVLLGVRNDGNAPQDVRADIIVELDGVAKPDVVTDGIRKELRDMRPGETRPVTWSLVPTEPGAYRVAIALIRSDGTSEPLVERRLFVQRSTGLICYDAIDARECGPAFRGELVPALLEQTVTAALLGPDGTLYVATDLAEAEEGQHRGQLAARDPATGAWRRLANLSGTVLNETFAQGPEAERGWGDIRSLAMGPDGSLWLVGDNTTVLRWRPTGALNRIPVLPGGTASEPVPVSADLTSALWHDGTLLAAGTNGTLLRLVDQNMTRVEVHNATLVGGVVKLGAARYDGVIRALAHAPNGDAVLLGDRGVLLSNAPGSTTWSEATIGETPLAFAIQNRTLRAAASFEGRLYVAGTDAILVSTTAAPGILANATKPAPLQNLARSTPAGALTDYRALVPSHIGELLVVDYEGRLAACSGCADPYASWRFIELPLPTVLVNGPAHLAALTGGVGDGVTTTLVGEAGLVLDLVAAGDYPNDADWTAIPSLAPRDGGILEMQGSTDTGGPRNSQALVAIPDDAGRAAADRATKFRLFLNHSVQAARDRFSMEIRLVHVNFPAVIIDATGTSPQATCPLSTTSRDSLTTATVCNHQRVRTPVALFRAPTTTDGWEARVFDNIPTIATSLAVPAGGQSARDPATFYGLEFFANESAAWALDDFRLQALVDNKWTDVVEWRGPALRKGAVYASNLGSTVDNMLVPVPRVDPTLEPTRGNASDTLGDAVEGSPDLRTPRIDPLGQTTLAAGDRAARWVESQKAPFGVDVVTPWHITTQYADRPVFAANSEFYINPELAGGSTPRLYSNWNARLVSPVIDLRDAYDPLVSFRHTYAFRTQSFINEGGPLTTADDRLEVQAGDGGVLEIQYLKQGEDCGSSIPTVTCGWSRFFVVEPDGGYPTAAQLGYTGSLPLNLNAPAGTAELNRIGQAPGGLPLSYWGRTAFPDVTGAISSPRETDTYQRATVTLANVTCTPAEMDRIAREERVDCVPTSLTGRQIRFAFRILTATEDKAGERFNKTNPTSATLLATFPGEGWYITDFKVAGATRLGIDLGAENMTFRVGYDVGRIGLGPGTRVPVNVTVRNNGTFDVLGYTGELEIRRILDPALGTSVRVETLALGQQPVLEGGKTANHTLYWSVPAYENGNYTLTFTVTPIGIDRDEDPVDNVARLGSLARPINARTVREFNVEFLVSPENATIDITRYVPMFVNNTGNVPLDGFTFERRITVIGRQIDSDAQTCADWRRFVAESRRSAIVDCRTWRAQHAAPPGALTPVSALSEEVSPSADLFWKAPERASFLVSVSAATTIGSHELRSAVDRRVSAFATYLFDDVEGGVRGEARRGEWNYTGWNLSQPGFRSTDAYAFGDVALGRYAPGANDSLVSPVIDLGSARTASVAFFHRFRFEEGFDGGVVEASADGGKTWTTLPPVADSKVEAGYNASFPIQAASPLHPSQDPQLQAFGFTSDSALHPANVDSWVLSQFDLTRFSNVTEKAVPYVSFGTSEIRGYQPAPETPRLSPNVYIDPSWCTGDGDVNESRCWEVHNLTEGTRVPPTRAPAGTENTMWWSGSASVDDDRKRVIENNGLFFDVDISGVAADQVVTADWWEYASRFASRGLYLEAGQPGTEIWPTTPWPLMTAYQFHPGGSNAQTYRLNLGKPEILETQGRWYHMQADLTKTIERLREQGVTSLRIGFVYSPVTTPHASLAEGLAEGELNLAENTTGQSAAVYGNGQRYADDPGFAIDGLVINATRVVRGQPLGDPTVLFAESTGWDARVVRSCGYAGFGTGWVSGNALDLPCLDNNRQSSDVRAEWTLNDPLIIEDIGRNWGLVTVLPAVNSSWGIVTVRDHDGHSPRVPLPTADPQDPGTPKAWWSGELPYNDGVNDGECVRGPASALVPSPVPCPQPLSESRLVTPAFDLGRIAGNNAQLSFWHRYAFSAHPVGGDVPLASGGVVEIQVFDAASKQWGPWKQLYTQEGGYLNRTANTSEAGDGVRRFDPPFENVLEGKKAYQYLYSGNSTDRDHFDGTRDGWIRSEYDLTEHLGKRVRIGFHYAFSDLFLPAQAPGARLNGPDTTLIPFAPPAATTLDDYGGWWISDVSIVGDVIVGKPVQLRLRAGSDANVQEGFWQVDDFGVFGSRYRNNVGLFVEPKSGGYGATNASTVSIPITVRNLGDTVRRDLAVEVVDAAGVGLTFAAPDAPRSKELSGRSFRLEGFTLGPGQSTTVDLVVTTPKEIASFTASGTTLLLTLKEFSPASPQTPYVNIVGNEVQGLLTREIPLALQDTPRVLPGRVLIRSILPALGDAVDVEINYHNAGFGPATMNLSCTAQSITDFGEVNHLAGHTAEKPLVAATYPCERISGNLTLAGRESTTIVYRVTPTTAGFLTFRVNGTVVTELPNGATVRGPDIAERRAGIAVGVSPLVRQWSFDTAREVTENFTFRGAGGWEYLRGNDRPGSLLIGIPENATANPFVSYSACRPCRAIGPPMDLHNYSLESGAFLSLRHMDRLARYDGARVMASVLRDETKPVSQSSWSRPCILQPRDGYEGVIREIPTPPADGGRVQSPSDPQMVFSTGQYTSPTTERDFFVSTNGIWEESWTYALFDLTQECVEPNANPALVQSHTLVGRTIRLEFEVWGGDPNLALMRQRGQGMLIDDITVGPFALDVRPTAPQVAKLLDNTTKRFHVVVQNDGSVADRVHLEYDGLNSSAPAGSVRIPPQTVTLIPGEQRVLAADVTLPRDPSLLPTDFKARVLARSEIDRTALGSARLDLAFGPRPWAELALRAEPPTGIVQEGTEQFVALTIENTGLTPSVDTTIRVVDSWANGSATFELPLASILPYETNPEDSTRVLEFRWRPEKGSIGPHTLTFEIDPAGLGEEYTRTNNVAVLIVDVSDLLIPDLHVGDFQALALRNAAGGLVTPAFTDDVARYEVTAGELVSFEVKVANKGRAGATNVDVRAFIGALSLPPKTIPYIAPGNEVIVGFNWLAQKGEHEIEFLVRSEQVELTTTNNRYPGLGVTLLTVKGYEVDVQIGDLLEALLEPATTVELPFRVHNSGNAGEDIVLRATSPPGTRILLPKESFFLLAGSSYSDTARLILDAEAVAGEHFITIEAVARENPMKVASGSAAMRVNASYGGSVAGGIVAAAPTTVVLPIELVNEGNSLEPWSVLPSLPSGWVPAQKLPVLVSVPAHGKKTLDLQLTLPAGTTPGDRVIPVKATLPDGQKREGLVRATILPLRAAGVEVSEALPKADRGTLTIPVKVENKGNVQQPFQILLVEPPAGVELRIEPARFDLPPGGEAVAQLVMKPNASVEAGTYAVTGYTLFEGVQPQTAEGRANIQSLQVPIVRQDLRIASLEFSPRAGLSAGDRVTVKASVVNRGSTELTQVPVHLYVDDVFIEEVVLATLASGARVDATFNWTAVTGPHTLTAVVDPYSDTVEADRVDNSVSSLATVGSETPVGGIAAGRADTPAPGAIGLLLAALVAALLLTPSRGSRRQRR